jgi:DNA-binding MarR family transcriptional regulator
MAPEKQHELELLEALEAQPETSQVDLAVKVGVAVGTVNWYLKRWAAKGYVKIKRIGRWRWRYLLTPTGMKEKTRLAGEYLEASMSVYRRTRSEAKRLLLQVKDAGYDQVRLQGEGDIAEIAELTCLELSMRILGHSEDISVPVLMVNGTTLELIWNSDAAMERKTQ